MFCHRILANIPLKFHCMEKKNGAHPLPCKHDQNMEKRTDKCSVFFQNSFCTKQKKKKNEGVRKVKRVIARMESDVISHLFSECYRRAVPTKFSSRECQTGGAQRQSAGCARRRLQQLCWDAEGGAEHNDNHLGYVILGVQGKGGVATLLAVKRGVWR